MVQASISKRRYGYLDVRDIIAQNSVLLWSLDDVPGENEEFKLLDQQNGYQLPIQREKQLSEDFAFLAAHVKDPYRVMAAAVEEDQDKQGITIRIATNKGELTNVQQGLKSIAEVLQRAAARFESRTDLQPCLLRAIVAFDFKRILSRLRSRHAPTDKHSDRASRIHLLNKHIDSGVQVSPLTRVNSSTTLREQCTALKNVSDQFEAMQIEEVKSQVGHKMLADILQKIARIVKDFDLVSIFKRSKTMDPTLLESLPLSLRKLAKYYTLSWDLIDAARDSKYSVFRTIRIVPLHAKNLIGTAVIRKRLSFEKTLLRFLTKRTNSSIINKARAKSMSLTSKKTTYNVHAEIQLLSYYQSQVTPGIEGIKLGTPRVLSASKLACYLCSLFIRIHGRFQIGGTHGKLYTRCTLPDLPECVESESFLTAMHSLNQHLENEIRKKLAGPLLKPKFPNESVVVVNPSWSPCSTLTALKPSAQHSATTLTRASFSLQQRDKPLIYSSCNPKIRDVASGTNSSVHTDSRVSAIIAADNDGEMSNKLANIELATSSGSDDRDSCFRITSDWKCFRLSLPSAGIWCYCKGLELFLNLEDNEPSKVIIPNILHNHWVGIKYVNIATENQYRYTNDSLDVVDLHWDTHQYRDGSTTNTMPLVLNWLDGAVVIKAGLAEPPPDPFP